MKNNISEKIIKDFKGFKMIKIESGASKKILYRINYFNKSYIVTNYYFNKEEYKQTLYIYSILKNINITIPKIIKKYDDIYTIVSEDFGDLRYDKIFTRKSVKEILFFAVETLVNINNSIEYGDYNIPKYNFIEFQKEIMEITEYYFPYIKIYDKYLIKEFNFIWTEIFNNIKFEFNSFCHKDFNFNNLILIPSNDEHLKCGVIDYQGAFWGESSWDLFSLLEDSRIMFTNEYNEYFIKYYYSKTKQNNNYEDFRYKYNFLNASRQTRLLGRWIKLSDDLKEKSYLNFIPTTMKRLKESINLINNNKLSNFYNKYIFNEK